jgi:phospho-N-acetylmuramoyl-pentapeptide-transferase
MLYHLLVPLTDTYSFFNIFRYITFRSAYAAIASLAIAFVIGPWIIRRLRASQMLETIRDDGPAGHAVKRGTPTMGGLIILMASLVPTLLFARLDNPFILVILFVTLWMGVIGFIDDYLKVARKLKRGLVAKYKMMGQITLGLLVGLFILYGPMKDNPLATITTVPFLKNHTFDWGWLFIPMVIFVITAASNAVNLTDGLDGLSIGLSAIAFIAFAGMAYVTGHVKFSNYLAIPYISGTGELTVFCAAMIGAALGFLWFNAHPASIFMGDVGSLPIGAALGTLAILVKKELLLLVVGAVFVGETLSVILQVGYFKWTRWRTGQGRRLLKMAPIHHHFELSGWEETKIVTRFYVLGILFALLSLSTFKIR